MIQTRMIEKVLQTGTPAFVFDERDFQDRFGQINQILNGNMEKGSANHICLCYAFSKTPFHNFVHQNIQFYSY